MITVNTKNLGGDLTYRPFIVIPDYTANYVVDYELTDKEVIELLSDFTAVDQSNEKEKYSVDRLNSILELAESELHFFVKATKESILKENRLVDLDLNFANSFDSWLTADSDGAIGLSDFDDERIEEFSRSQTLLYRHRSEIKIYSDILDKIMITIKKAFEEEDKKRTLSIQDELDLYR